jgi:hypothetical protein
VSDEKKCSDDWLCEAQYRRFIVVDPDGWDRMNFEASWAEEITEPEFNARLMGSSVLLRS